LAIQRTGRAKTCFHNFSLGTQNVEVIQENGFQKPSRIRKEIIGEKNPSTRLLPLLRGKKKKKKEATKHLPVRGAGLLRGDWDKECELPISRRENEAWEISGGAGR